MSEDVLKDYLLQQARSLDSLLELTPAKNMFGEDVSDQWKRKKQTPEQKKAARMAKLDPANWKSAKDVYHERSAEAARKRKREDHGLPDEHAPTADGAAQPSKKHKGNDTHPAKKPVPTEKLVQPIDKDALGNKNLVKRMKKRAARSAKKQAMREEQEQTKADTTATVSAAVSPDKTKRASEKSAKIAQNSPLDAEQPEQSTKNPIQRVSRSRQEKESAGERAAKQSKSKLSKADEKSEVLKEEDSEHVRSDASDENGESEDPAGQTATLEPSEVGNQAQDDEEEDENARESNLQDTEDAQSTATSSEGVPDVLSPQPESAASSISSIVPPSQPQPQKAKTTHSSQQPQPQNVQSVSQSSAQSDADRLSARQRLQQQISQFRSQRKADEKPVRSRAELLAQRRQKEQERKEAKKAQRRQEKEEEARRQDEEIARRFSPGGSGSLLASPRSPMIDDGGSNAFTFGRIAFEDGTAFDPTTGSASAGKKSKGPIDPVNALKLAQAKSERLSGLDEEKRKEIAEKDMWQNAKKKAHGERVKDDMSLLKKALKRQEKQKARSEKEWDSRVEGVRSAQEAKQKRRTENLAKRREEKVGKKGKTGKPKVRRPGFEGSFKSRGGSGGKKK